MRHLPTHDLLASLAFCAFIPVVVACGAPAVRQQRTPAGTATVIRTVDGDTVDIEIAGLKERVRLLGVDTPETKDPRKPVQCFGEEASARLAALLPVGTKINVQRDTEARDRYGRLLLYIWRASDGLFINLRLALEGDADQLSIAPNFAHRDEIGHAVAEAKANERGLWGACGRPGLPADDPGS